MSKQLASTVTGITDPLDINVATSHTAAVATAIIKTVTTSLSIGDSIDVSLGYVGDVERVFRGYVKQIDREIGDNLYTVTAQDTLVRALDFFIVAADPDNPFSRQNITAEGLIEDLLALAGLTNYNGDATSFSLAIGQPVEINLVSVYDYTQSIARIVAWNLWADEDGIIQFIDRKPYVMGSDTAFATITDPTILDAGYQESDKDLRNKVVVYGANGIVASASASSPYLPSGFFKSVVLSTPIIDSQSVANSAASFNLAMLNRLTKSLNIEVEGSNLLLARKVIEVVQTDLSVSGDWYIYSATHTFNSSGYKVGMEIRQ